MPSLRRFPPAGAVTLLLVLFASSAHAQDPGRPRATKDERSARVDEASRTSAATASESDAGRWFVGTVSKRHQAYFDDAANQVAEDLVSTATRKQAVPPSLPARR